MWSVMQTTFKCLVNTSLAMCDLACKPPAHAAGNVTTCVQTWPATSAAAWHFMSILERQHFLSLRVCGAVS